MTVIQINKKVIYNRIKFIINIIKIVLKLEINIFIYNINLIK